MKKIVFIAATCFVAMNFASCSSDVDMYDGGLVQSEAVKANVQKVFGTTFDPNHDWKTTTQGELTIQANSRVKKVQIMAYVNDYGPNNPWYVTANTLKVLNQTELNGRTTVKLNYDAPTENLGLYVAFVYDNDFVLKEVKGNTVSVNDPASARDMVTRASSIVYKDYLPKGNFTIANIEASYANERGWNNYGNELYQLADYTAQKMATPEYDSDFVKKFRAIVFSYFPNGRDENNKRYNNLPKVKASGYYNEKVYPITTGDEEPIVVTPIYKCDNPLLYGNEVYYSDLYYYYFKDTDPDYLADPVTFIKKLPKYKAIPFCECFGFDEDSIIKNHGSYALLYYGEGKPAIGKKGEYKFDPGYKIGFMVRCMTDYNKGGSKKGEVYADGRMNNEINFYKDTNFKSSNLGQDGPRAAWLAVEGRSLLCWESGTDSDFNDIILDVAGGIEGILPPPVIDDYDYTYCFEDRDLGDYDMNDVVIKAARLDETHVAYTLAACGAQDELYIHNINVGMIQDNIEVHAIFGKQQNEFINTGITNNCEPVTVIKTVSADFSFTDEETMPYISNATTGVAEIRVAKKGEDPHAILVATDFSYPLERTCIKDAYDGFNSWGENPLYNSGWYNSPNLSRVHSSR